MNKFMGKENPFADCSLKLKLGSALTSNFGFDYVRKAKSFVNYFCKFNKLF